jgi:Ca2+-binding RTX toxin-like protein
VATINGTSGNDTLSGTAGDDTISGFGGNDVFLVGSTGGNDLIDGGAGFDSIEFRERATSAVVVDFRTGSITGGSSGTISFANVERVLGGNFADTLTGNAAGQNLTGRFGADTLWGGGGVDTLWGGGDGNTFVFRETGTANADRIGDFASGSDKILLDASVMSALGASGNFIAGDDRFVANSSGTAQDAEDRIIFNTTTKQVFYDADGSGLGAAVLIATLQSSATLAGTDIVVEGGRVPGGDQTINGTSGDDSLLSGPGNDTINGFGGNDLIFMVDEPLDSSDNPGNDAIDGGEGIDTVVFSDDNAASTEAVIVDLAAGTYSVSGPTDSASGTLTNIENVQGSLYDDELRGTDGPNELLGASGSDTIFGFGGGDVIAGGTGSDLIFGGAGDDNISDGFGEHPNDGLSSDSIDGAEGNDSITVTAGDDTVNAGAGDDWIFITLAGNVDSYGNDRIDGGADDDTLTFYVARGPLVVDLAAGTLTGGGTGGASLTGIENFRVEFGDIADDRISGSSAANLLAGDTGNDTLDGRAGNDTLSGGAGVDHFFFSTAPGLANADSIVDFAWGTDKLHLDAAVMTELGTTGNFQSGDGRFYAADGATGGNDFNDRVIFNTRTKQVFYDPDGSGSGAAELIATLAPGTFITADDIVVENGMAPGGTLSGTEGDDTITGSSGDDTINGLGGNDVLLGNAGNDSLDGGAGRDDLHGGDGNDTLVVGDNDDSGQGQFLNGGPGDDVMIGSASHDAYMVDSLGDSLTDTGGHDAVFSSVSFVAPEWLEQLTLMGSASINATGNNLNNTLHGNAGANVLQALGGNDWVDGAFGNDTLSGGAGFDRFAFTVTPGSANADVITDFATGANRIVLDGAVHTNIGANGVFRPGDARFFAGPGANSGQDPSDRVIYNSTSGELWYDGDGSGAGAALLIASLQGVPSLAATDIEVFNGSSGGGQVIDGTSGNDLLVGGPADDTIYGFAGDDTIDGGPGADSMIGGAGADTYVVDNPGDLIVEEQLGGMDLVNASVTYTLPAWVNSLTLTGSEAIDATGNDIINVLVGNGAANALSGGLGADTLTGGGGGDRFLFTTAPAEDNADRITDFSSGSDKIVLDGSVMTALGASGNFAAGDARFAANSTGTASDAGDRVIYETDSQQVWYDADGNGAGARQLIATLQSGATLVATDIVVVNGSTPPPDEGEVINGTSGNDTLSGTAGNDTINGLGGNDLLLAGSTGGADLFDGGTGLDSIEFRERATSPVVVDFAAGTITGGSSGSISFANIERVLGGNFDDILTGNAASQNLTGRHGADTLWGAGGVDTLWGGGDGNTFIFRETGTANADRISDWVSGVDTLALDNAAMSALGTDGDFVAGDTRFASGSGFTSGRDASDRVVFDTSTGRLYYDADGSGSGASQLIATVQSGATVAATDIMVI